MCEKIDRSEISEVNNDRSTKDKTAAVAAPKPKSRGKIKCTPNSIAIPDQSDTLFTGDSC